MDVIRGLVYEFITTFVDVLIPEYLPEQLNFLRVIAYVYAEITLILVVLSPVLFAYGFWKHRRFN